ncbi:cytochrome P450 81Q32-like [Salvia splendens]|uniref:cytochrome P450 81Q32-like n=1 Tax=Salvia splendens TaxID=180675 RepID=UPI001C254935|nr:cytochrome P450 81Q32-like [Salvia splendens]
MELPLIFSITLTIVLSIFLIYKRPRHRLPPSPAVPLPILGHLHLLKQPLHRTFHRLSQSTGPIFSLKLGLRRAVVVSSPALVDECFTKNDVALANRPNIIIDEYIGYNHTTMSGAPYGDLWRSLRRIAAQEVLSGARLTAFSEIRHDEVKSMLLSLMEKETQQQKKSLSEKESRGFSEVELRPRLLKLSFNNMMRMLAPNNRKPR